MAKPIRLRGEADGWHHGDARFPDQSDVVPDGANWLFAPLTTGTPDFYREFARSCYETELDPAAIDPIYRGTPLTQQMINQLNPDVSLTDIADDLAQIGYPVSR